MLGVRPSLLADNFTSNYGSSILAASAVTTTGVKVAAAAVEAAPVWTIVQNGSRPRCGPRDQLVPDDPAAHLAPCWPSGVE